MRGKPRNLILFKQLAEGNKERNDYLRSDNHILCSVLLLLCLIVNCDQAGYSTQIKAVFWPLSWVDDHLEFFSVHDFFGCRAL